MLKKLLFVVLISSSIHLIYSASTDDVSQLLSKFDKPKPDERLVQVHTLLANGADINTSNEEGDTLLHLAAEAGDEALVDFLLTQPNVNINAQNEEGDTPLLLAILGEEISCIQKLIAQKVDLTVADKKGLTALHVAARRNSLECIKILIAAGAPLTLTDKKKRTPGDLTTDDACRTLLDDAMAAQTQSTAHDIGTPSPAHPDVSTPTIKTPPHPQSDETKSTNPPPDPHPTPSPKTKPTNTKRFFSAKLAGRIAMTCGGLITGTLGYTICKKAHQNVVAEAEKSNTKLSKKEYLKALYTQLKSGIKSPGERRQYIGVVFGLICIAFGAGLETWAPD